MRIGFLSHLDANLYLFRLPIMRRLVERGDEVFAIAPRGIYWDAFLKEGIRPIDYSIERGSLNPLKELRAIKEIYRAIRPLNLEILHTFTAKPNIYGTFAGCKAGIPVIYNLVEGLGSFYVEDGIKNRFVRSLQELLYRKAFKRSNLCVFVNRDDPDYMVRRGLISPEKVKIIRSVGVDTKRFRTESVDEAVLSRWRKELSPRGLPVVLMVARAIWHKGIREFYEAARRLEGRAEFILVGGTDVGNPSCADEGFLRSGAVRWLGERDVSEMVGLTAACDLYVLPSYREGVPRTLLEAASMGKALVATDVVGCREVVEHGVNGLLVPPRDAAALAGAIGRLLEDQALRERMGEASRKLALAEFDVDRVVEQYLPLYRRDGASDVL